MRSYRKNILGVEKHTYAPELNKVVFKNNNYIDLKDFEKLEKIKEYKDFFKYAKVEIKCESYDKLDSDNNMINYSQFTDIKEGTYISQKDFIKFIKDLKLKNGVSENFKKVVLNKDTDREIIYYRKITLNYKISFIPEKTLKIKTYKY